MCFNNGESVTQPASQYAPDMFLGQHPLGLAKNGANLSTGNGNTLKKQHRPIHAKSDAVMVSDPFTCFLDTALLQFLVLYMFDIVVKFCVH